MWDPASYLRYDDERSRPFHDLIARVAADRPRAVVDLGCGPGHLTATLALRWPHARIAGFDSSPEMIDKARERGSEIDFAVADVRDFAPGPDADVVVSNAVLQWVPGHDALLTRWVAQMPPDGWLAVQVPGNFDAASHRALRAVAGDPRWRAALAPPVLREAPVRDAAGYATLLADAGCSVDAWETTYVHLLPAREAADHPVLTWMEGTALRPVRATLGGGEEWVDFRTALGERLVRAYPIRGGMVYFPFRRVFFVARTPGSPEDRGGVRPDAGSAPPAGPRPVPPTARRETS